MTMSWLCAVTLLCVLGYSRPQRGGRPELARIHAPHETPQEGDLRLARFDRQHVPGTGNVMVYHGGEWGTICDDGWNLDTAHVVCRTLGYPDALGFTTQSHFGRPEDERMMWLDDVQCFGDEWHLFDCYHANWGVTNCDQREAAGVFCSPNSDFSQPKPRPRFDNRRPEDIPTTTTTEGTSTTTTTQPSTSTQAFVRFIDGDLELDDAGRPKNIFLPSRVDRKENDVLKQANKLKQQHGDKHIHFPKKYRLRLAGGRHPDEGRVELRVAGKWGVICSDHWSVLEAEVICRQLGKGHGRSPLKGGYGGEDMPKLAAGIRCDGTEAGLHECYHTEFGSSVECDKVVHVAGVECTDGGLPDLVPNATLVAKSAYLEDRPLYYLECAMEENCASATAFHIRENRRGLPDLVPNATLVQTSAYIDERPLFYMQCAMEENCASSTAFQIKQQIPDWHVHRRRLLRFSSSTWNFGTADFNPFKSKGDWEWHQCHMHYHSMDVFATYDLLDHYGNKVAEGHKASFCLEDVQCTTGVEKKYVCKNLGTQGISVGCADDYLHDIDCQWIDVTDVLPGSYIFRMHVNPGLQVAELSYDNNAVTCELDYNGYNVQFHACTLGSGLD